MKKKLVSIALASSLVIGMTFGNSMQSVNAASQTQIDSDDVLTTLNDITIAGQAWENIGFESDDIAEIMQMQRKDSSYYEALSTNISQLSLVTSETEELENSIIEQGYIEPYAQDGNPPETPQEQNERLQYVTQVALNRYSSKYNTTDFEKYVLYLYMSHYIDNPNYTKESPGFDSIYADLEEEDVDQQYIETCVSGLLGVLAGTTTILGFGMSISLCYYNFYSNLYDKAKLTALHYSL